jgi:hypothetical protein
MHHIDKIQENELWSNQWCGNFSVKQETLAKESAMSLRVILFYQRRSKYKVITSSRIRSVVSSSSGYNLHSSGFRGLPYTSSLASSKSPHTPNHTWNLKFQDSNFGTLKKDVSYSMDRWQMRARCPAFSETKRCIEKCRLLGCDVAWTL